MMDSERITAKTVHDLAELFEASLDPTSFENMGGRRKCTTRKPNAVFAALQELASNVTTLATPDTSTESKKNPRRQSTEMPDIRLNVSSLETKQSSIGSLASPPFSTLGLNAFFREFLKQLESPKPDSLPLMRNSLSNTISTPDVLDDRRRELATTFFKSLNPEAQFAFLREHVIFRSHGYEWITSNYDKNIRNPAVNLYMKKRSLETRETAKGTSTDLVGRAIESNIVKKELKAVSSKKGVYGDANSKFHLKIPVITHEEGYLQRKPQLVFVLGNSFTRGGDVRDPMNGRLIFSVHKKRVGGRSTLFLLDEEHGKKPVWKLSERPGEAGSSYDLYGRSATTGCGASGWRLRGQINRIASCASMLPRFLISCMGASVALAGDSMSGEDYVFHDILTSEVVGTLFSQSIGRSNAKNAKDNDDGQVFYEQMKLMFDAPIECFQQSEIPPDHGPHGRSFGAETHQLSLQKSRSNAHHTHEHFNLPSIHETHVPLGRGLSTSPSSNIQNGLGSRVASNVAPPHSTTPSTPMSRPTTKSSSRLQHPHHIMPHHETHPHTHGQRKSLYQDKFKLKISAANTTIAARHNCLPLSQLVLPPEMFLAGALVVLFMIREERDAILRLEK